MTIPAHIYSSSPESGDLDFGGLQISPDTAPSGALSMPFANPAVQSIADLIVKLNSVMSRSEELLSLTSQDVFILREYLNELIELEKEFGIWADSQCGEWQPNFIRSAEEESSKTSTSVLEMWPGPIESFYDSKETQALSTNDSERRLTS